MFFCTAVRQAGKQPHFSMIHKKGILTHSDNKKTHTNFGQRFAFICLIMINLTVIFKILVANENENIALASIDFVTRKV